MHHANRTTVEALAYHAKPYAVAAVGVVGISTGNAIGIGCGVIAIAAGAYIGYMRRKY